MAARFDRFLSEDIFGNLSELRDLIQLITTIDVKDPYALDIHLREKDKIMNYHGTTCVLTIALKRKDHPFTAHQAYGQNRDCSSAYHKLVGLRAWSGNEAKTLMKEYLVKIQTSVSKSKYSKEGLWMNKMGVRFGRRFKENDPWLIVDREAVIGFGDKVEKWDFYQRLKDSCDGFVNKLQVENEKKWGKNCKSFGDELDFLALDKERNLVCIELKHGDTSAPEIYWGPIQASVYQEAFRSGVQSREVSNGIEKMVRQKVKLGLLPESALNRLPVEGGFTHVRGILLIAEPNPKRGLCFQKLDEVKRRFNTTERNIQVSTVKDGQADLAIN